MAADWIKIREDLHEDAAVLQIADRLKVRPEVVVGYLVRFWSWVSRNTADGTIRGVSLDSVEAVLNIPHFLGFMREVGWLEYIESTDGKAIIIPNFERHLSESAKKRANDQRRKQDARKRPDSVRKKTDKTRTRGEESKKRVRVKKELKEERKVSTAAPSHLKTAFEGWWSVVKRKTGKEAARKAYPKAIDRVRQANDWPFARAAEFLTERMTAWSASQAAADDVLGKLHPSTWLTQGRYDDDEETWAMTGNPFKCGTEAHRAREDESRNLNNKARKKAAVAKSAVATAKAEEHLARQNADFLQTLKLREGR